MFNNRKAPSSSKYVHCIVSHDYIILSFGWEEIFILI